MNKQTEKEFKIDVQGGNSKLRDKLSFLIDMIDSGKRFAAWVEVERKGEVEEDKSEFRYKKEWDTFEDISEGKDGQSLNLNVLYDDVRFGDVEMIVYPVSNQAKEFKDLLLYHLPEEYHYFTFEDGDMEVHQERPHKTQWGWISRSEQHVLPWAHLFTDMSEDHVYKIRRYEVSSFDDRELMFGDE